MPRGIDRERQVCALLRDRGWWARRMPGSFGTFDVLAIKVPFPGSLEWLCPAVQIKRVQMIEVKATKAGPYAGFGPRKRDALRQEARQINAEPLLCWWPPHGELKWIPEKDWP